MAPPAVLKTIGTDGFTLIELRLHQSIIRWNITTVRARTAPFIQVSIISKMAVRFLV
jgi:hypothetical protein